VTVLAIDAALGQCAVAVVEGEVVAAVRQVQATQGHAAVLPIIARDVLTRVGLSAELLSLVAVTVGPGSFTGIRAGLALAHGIGLAAGVPVIGVTVGEALADSLPHLGDRQFWVAIDSRRGRVFLERGASILSVALEALPVADGKVALAGDAAAAVAVRLAARDADVMLTDARLPLLRHVALVAQRRLRGEVSALPALPLYVDPPEVRLPVAGLRPPPVR
jgi:tRNA threonylcarbamoyl adenosine modification protein YeaZ